MAIERDGMIVAMLAVIEALGYAVSTHRVNDMIEMHAVSLDNPTSSTSPA